jgi:hypothetical protein
MSKGRSEKPKATRKRPEEEWAAKVITRHLGRIVDRNDDGSKASMYDLRVGSEDAPEIVIECVRDIDKDAITVWKRGPMESPIAVEAPGDWVIELTRSADVREVRKALPSLLGRLHATGNFNVEVDCDLQASNPTLFIELRQMGMGYVHCGNQQGSGIVGFTMSLVGGIVDESGNDIADWLTEFLERQDCRDNIRKLGSSGAAERHIFIMPTLNGTFIAPMFHHFEVTYALPQKAPILPPEITGAWIVPTATHTGLFWNGCSWAVVDGRG